MDCKETHFQEMQWIFVSLSYNVLVLCMYYVLYPVSCILYPVVNELANWHNTCLPNMQLCKSPIITHSFVHSFISLIHYKGATQRRSKPRTRPTNTDLSFRMNCWEWVLGSNWRTNGELFQTEGPSTWWRCGQNAIEGDLNRANGSIAHSTCCKLAIKQSYCN